MSVLLVRNGIAAAVIVTADREKGSLATIESESAFLLQDLLKRISGARIEIMGERALRRASVLQGQILAPVGVLPPEVQSFILIGESRLSRKLGVTSAELGVGGMRIKTMVNALVLLGHPTIGCAMGGPLMDGGGTRRAVVAFLEGLGCRYLWPGVTGLVLPRMTTIAVDATDISDTPPLGQRWVRPLGYWERPDVGMKAFGMTRADWLTGRDRAMLGAPAVEWNSWHGLGGDLGIKALHAFGKAWEKWGTDHPEWFALQPDGTRDQSAAGDRARLCKSNLGLIQAIADEIIERVHRQPELRSVSLSPNDGGFSSFCMCEQCRSLDPPDAPKVKLLFFKKVGVDERWAEEYPALTDRMVFFWNGIAERVTKVHPDLMFVVDAYSYFETPPVARKLHPNTVVRYVPDGTEGWEGWRRSGVRRIYWRPNILWYSMRDARVRMTGGYMARTFRWMIERGMYATDFDGANNHWAIHGLNYYTAAQLNWNPMLTYDQILDSYCTPGFGEGAEFIRRYFLRIEEADPRYKERADGSAVWFTLQLVAELRELLQAADKAAGDDEAVRARIAFLRLGLNCAELHAVLDRMAENAKTGGRVDVARARRLAALNALAMRDIIRNHHLAVNVAHMVWRTGNFARWESVLGTGWQVSDEALGLLADPRHTLSGSENSLDEMMAAFDLPSVSRESAQAGQGTRSTIQDADEDGQAAGVPGT